MPNPPTITHSGNTVTANYQIAQTNTQTTNLSTKDEKILKSLESALPFFDASDYGVKAEKGKADKPPVTDEGKKSGGAKEFFKNLGDKIKATFDKIGDFFKSLGKSDKTGGTASTGDTKGTDKTGGTASTGDTKGTDKTGGTASTGDTKGTEKPEISYDKYSEVKPNPDKPNKNAIGGQLAYAFEKGGQEGVKKYVGDLALVLRNDMANLKFTGTVEEFVKANAPLNSQFGYGLLGTTALEIKDMIPDLKEVFEGDAMALSVLNAIEKFDLEAAIKDSFTMQVDELNTAHNPLGKFMRNVNMVSTGLMSIAVSEGLDQKELAKSILTPLKDQVVELTQEMDKLQPHERKKEVLTGDVAEKMMGVVKSMLDQMLDPDMLIEAFGQDHIDRLNEMAKYVAGREDLPVDVRNSAIEKIYVDSLFLRTTMNGLTSTVGSPGKYPIEFAATQLAQSVLNGAEGDKFTSQDMKNAYQSTVDEFHQNFIDAMISLGMPVVK